MQGAGNDFVLIDNRQTIFTGSENALFRRLCRRSWGVGADGLILFDFRIPEEFNLRYYNPDGREAGMCGNGARCAVYLMHQVSGGKTHFQFRMAGEIYRGEVTAKEQVKIFWENAPVIRKIEGLDQIIPDDFSDFLVVHSGVPHLILMPRQPLSQIAVGKWGSDFRNHPVFSPEGVNVTFVELKDEKVHIRTFERGVEAETLSCGTGAVAAAIAAGEWGWLPMPLEVITQGGMLRVGREAKNQSVWLEGPVRKIFEGDFDPGGFE